MARGSTVDDKLEEVLAYLGAVDKNLRSLDKRVSRIERSGSIKAEPEEAEKPLKKSKPPKDRKSLEENLGMKWFGIIGGLFLVLGFVFLLKYAFDNNWIGHLGRIILGVAAGLVLVALAEFLKTKEKYQRYSRILAGIGFSITYFSIFAAYHFKTYREAIGIPQWADLALLTAVAVLTTAFALKDNSKMVVVLAFSMGYLTAFLSTDLGTMALLYTMILTIVLFVVASIKGWGDVALGGIIPAYLVYYAWYSNHSREDMLFPVLFLVTYFVIFTLLNFLLKHDNKNVSNANVFLAIINSLIFYGLLFMLLASRPFNAEDWRGLITLALAAVYFALAYAATMRDLGAIKDTFLGLMVLYLTVTIPVQFDNSLVTVLWSAEALTILVLALYLGIRPLRYFAYGVGVVAFCKTLLVDTFALRSFDADNIFGSTRLIAYLATITAFYVSAYLINRNKDSLESDSKGSGINDAYAAAAYFLGATALTTVVLGLELKSYWITMAWAVQAITTMFAGFVLSARLLRLTGIGLFAIVIVKAFLMDTSTLAVLYRTISFITLGIILLTASFIYAKYKDRLKELV